jgi:hypothetical protein
LKALGGAVPDTAGSPSPSPAASATDATAPAADASAGRSPEQAAALQAWIAIPQPVMAWRVIDQFARLIGGAEPATGPLPSQLLTGGNAADAVLDEALWGVK